jgi:type II secretory pathway pseudopilin PulG
MKRRQKGFTYPAVMFIVAVMLLLSAAASAVWHVQQRRGDERELLFIGREYRRAIEQYRLRGGAQPQPFPKSLHALVSDLRAPMPQRYARRIYADPITHERKWGVLLAQGGAIVGVYSLGKGKPLKRQGFDTNERFDDAASYRDWRFVLPAYDKQSLRHGIAVAGSTEITNDPAFHDAVIETSSHAEPLRDVRH